MPTIAVYRWGPPPPPRGPLLNSTHWALLTLSAAVPVGLGIVLRALRPDLIAGAAPVLIAAPLLSIPVTFTAQLAGFALVGVARLQRWAAAAALFICWVIPMVVFTGPALFLTVFGPVVSAWARVR